MKTAFVFPGQGAQQVGMGQALARDFDVCRRTFAEADEALGEALSTLCFEGPAERLQLTENAQPAILAVSVAAYRLVQSAGVRPAFAAGHSVGEYAAHVAAGTLSFADALRTVRRRGRYMQEAVPVGEGAMAAIIALEEAAVDAACREAWGALPGGGVGTANLNGPGQIVIAGHADAVAKAGELARAAGARRVISLSVSAPFHCPLMRPAQERLAVDLRAVAARDPEIPVIANVDAVPKRTAREAVEALIEQVSAPVRWQAVVEWLVKDGVTRFVELGPGTVLAGLIRKIDRGVAVVSVGDGVTAEALAQLSGEAGGVSYD
jgi:[acyl-carrier-protein] S-malonyltransferase